MCVCVGGSGSGSTFLGGEEIGWLTSWLILGLGGYYGGRSVWFGIVCVLRLGGLLSYALRIPLSGRISAGFIVGGREQACWAAFLRCGWKGGKLFYAFGWLFVIYVAWRGISLFLGLEYEHVVVEGSVSGSIARGELKYRMSRESKTDAV